MLILGQTQLDGMAAASEGRFRARVHAAAATLGLDGDVEAALVAALDMTAPPAHATERLIFALACCQLRFAPDEIDLAALAGDAGLSEAVKLECLLSADLVDGLRPWVEPP